MAAKEDAAELVVPDDRPPVPRLASGDSMACVTS
jgi:hypothetical protein